MHAAGAQLCSTCSGVLLLAETGLLDGKDATVHWMYAQTFRRNFPNVRLRLDRALVAAGKHQEFLMSGASTSWHDLILYLIAQHAGPTAAQAVAKFFAFQCHADGLSPYIVFEPVTDHGDAAIDKAQSWLGRHFSVANPVEQAARISGIPERSFKRRPPDNEFSPEQSAASRRVIEEYLGKTKIPLWIEHDYEFITKLKKAPAYYD